MVVLIAIAVDAVAARVGPSRTAIRASRTRAANARIFKLEVARGEGDD